MNPFAVLSAKSTRSTQPTSTSTSTPRTDTHGTVHTLNKHTLLLGLHRNQAFNLPYHATLQVVRGKIQIYGGTISAGTRKINAGGNRDRVEIKECKETKTNETIDETDEYEIKHELYEEIVKIDHRIRYHTIVLITNHNEEKHDILPHCDENSNMISYQLPVELKSIVNTRVAFVGHKSSGKSTTARKLYNYWISKLATPIAYLDADLGQPEFTVPGVVSLTLVRELQCDPPHLRTGSHRQEAAIHYGSVSGEFDPMRYYESLRALVAYYNNNLAHLPLIVNMSGWIIGFGGDISAAITRLIDDVLVVCMGTSDPKWLRNDEGDFLYEEIMQIQNKTVPQVMEIPCFVQDLAERNKTSGIEHRTLRYLHYFHAEDKDIPLWKKKPYRIPLQRLTLISASSEDQSVLSWNSLDGCLVGLRRASSDSAEGHLHTEKVGVVHSSDSAYLYVYCPLPLVDETIIVRGDLETPSHLLMNEQSGHFLDRSGMRAHYASVDALQIE